MRRRRKSTHVSRDPRNCKIILDNNALRPPLGDPTTLVAEFKLLEEALRLDVIKPYGVQAELQRAPKSAQDDMDGIYSIPVGLTPDEEKRRATIRQLMRGNAASEKHQADADHLFEAEKYGGGYFITHDKRILAKASAILEIAPLITISTLAEFIDTGKAFLHPKKSPTE